MDLIIRNARLKKAETLCDIGVENGLITAIEPRLVAKGKEEVDAGGNLTCPPLCDPHLHLDAALSVGHPRHNNSGTLLEGIKIWGEYKQGISKEAVKEKAKEAVLWEFANGVQFIRTHADTTEPKLITVEALLELKDEMKDLAEIQIVAFPQDGVFTDPSGAMQKLMIRAMDMGADVVGGIPHIELTREDGVKDVEFAFTLAEKYSALIDIHCDETGDEQSRFVEVILKRAIETGMGSRVTASHTTAMHNYNNDYALKLMGIAARSKVNFITNPFDNSVLQNRTDGYPRRRGHTRVDQLDANGVNVSIGHDSIMDPWYPMGTGSMLQAANLLMHTAHMSGRGQIPRLFSMITDNSAITMNVAERYCIEKDRPANIIVLDATDEIEAVRRMPVCLYSIRGGKVLLRSKPAERLVSFGDAEWNVDFKI